MKGVNEVIDVRTAISMVEKQFPNKRMRGGVDEFGNIYLFQFVDKDATEEEVKWDNGLIGVDKVTGKISHHSAFDLDILFGDVKPITEY